jgi:hypothetical protein
MKEKIGSIQFASSGGTALIVVPSLVALDSTWPFCKGEKVLIRIEGQRVIVEKIPAPKVRP